MYIKTHVYKDKLQNTLKPCQPIFYVVVSSAVGQTSIEKPRRQIQNANLILIPSRLVALMYVCAHVCCLGRYASMHRKLCLLEQKPSQPTNQSLLSSSYSEISIVYPRLTRTGKQSHVG